MPPTHQPPLPPRPTPSARPAGPAGSESADRQLVRGPGRAAPAAVPDLPTQLGRTRRFTLGVPRDFTIARAGRTVLFLRSRAGDDPTTCLWALDPADPAGERLLADPAELTGTSGGPGIDGLATNRAGDLVTFTLAGGIWLIDLRDSQERPERAAGRVRRLPVEEPAVGAWPDPAGRWVAYGCRGELRLIGVDGGGDRALATPEGPDVAYGVVEEAGLVAMGGAEGCWWAPGGDRLLVARIDSSGVERWYLGNPAEPTEAPPSVRYAAVGKANAHVSLWLVNADVDGNADGDGDGDGDGKGDSDGGAPVEVRWEHKPFEYVVNAGSDGHGPYVAVQSRDQRTVRFLTVAPASGATAVAAEWRDPHWVQQVPGLPARTGSGALVAHLDDGETRQLAVAGAPVTPAGLQLREVHGVDGDEVLFGASEDPTATHLWSYHPDRGLRRLTGDPAVHTGTARDGTLVVVARDGTRPGGRVTARRHGTPAGAGALHRAAPAGRAAEVEIESRVELPVLAVRATGLVLGPRQLRAKLFWPSWFGDGDGGRLPVLVDPYSGASVQRVTAELDWRSLVSQWFAEHGFAVLVVDGRGTPGRGPGWERAVYGDVFGPVLDDQVEALQEAGRRHPELDLGRVGIRGWSFSGSLAVAAALRRPEVFHAAVAGAMVTDQRLYNTRWRERTLGHPDDFPEHYAATWLPAEAERLSRPLLLMHGLADSNVHPVHTMRLSEALLAAGREHELVLLPGIGHHAIGHPTSTGPVLRRQLQFLQRHLTG